jgi:hypothetical protein
VHPVAQRTDPVPAQAVREQLPAALL